MSDFFDFNGDGHIDGAEIFLGSRIIQESDLESITGYTFEQLEGMREEERDQILEQYGLEPDEYGF